MDPAGPALPCPARPVLRCAPMAIRVESRHFVVQQLEDGWMMDHEELEELVDLLKKALAA